MKIVICFDANFVVETKVRFYGGPIDECVMFCKSCKYNLNTMCRIRVPYGAQDISNALYLVITADF